MNTTNTREYMIKFVDYCKHCGSKLKAINDSSGWSQSKVCPECHTEVTIFDSDRMSGCLWDPIITIKYPDNSVEEINVPIKD